MELGQRLKQARLEAGLSQRQLCGDAITRNMLSRIENGSARPSMDTLALLAERLGRPVSFFLEEDGMYSPNQARLQLAREAYRAEAYDKVLEELECFTSPDPLLDPEKELLRALSLMTQAEAAIREKRFPFALHLLSVARQAGEETPYYGPELHRRWLLLAAKCGQADAAEQLPSLDAELLLRAEAALKRDDGLRCARLLDAAEDQDTPLWCLLRGEAAAKQGQYRQATELLHKAEDAFPERAIPLLERCYRELEDYKQAYFYACKQK